MKILVVDDNPTNLEMISLLLRSVGHDVLEAMDGASAVARAGVEMPAIVFMDLAMPGQFDGLDATRILKADPATREIVVIAVTAVVSKSDFREAAEAGCDAFIRKPYTRKELIASIARFFPDAQQTLVRRTSPHAVT